MADGSVGWCAMINCDGGYFTAFLEWEAAADPISALDAPRASGRRQNGGRGDRYVGIHRAANFVDRDLAHL
jgi:hypothetical protein